VIIISNDHHVVMLLIMMMTLIYGDNFNGDDSDCYGYKFNDGDGIHNVNKDEVENDNDRGIIRTNDDYFRCDSTVVHVVDVEKTVENNLSSLVPTTKEINSNLKQPLHGILTNGNNKNNINNVMYYDDSYIIRMNGCQVFNSEEEAFNKFHGCIPAIIVDDDDDVEEDNDHNVC